jgi:hypothetical protein
MNHQVRTILYETNMRKNLVRRAQGLDLRYDIIQCTCDFIKDDYDRRRLRCGDDFLVLPNFIVY